jgi:PadR family transcriptional regulator PadR
MAKNDLQGALDLLILKTLSQLWQMHGYGILMHIRRVSDELLIVEEGSLYPALHRMEQNSSVRACPWRLERHNTTHRHRGSYRKSAFSGTRKIASTPAHSIGLQFCQT